MMARLKALAGVVFLMACFVTAPAVSAQAAEKWDGRIIDVASGATLNLEDLAARLESSDIVVLAEKHYTPKVQEAQGEIIRALVSARHLEGNFTTSWEFLEFPKQDSIQASWKKFVAGGITAAQFLKETAVSGPSESYIPVLEATKAMGGNFRGVNVRELDRRMAAMRGIGAVDPSVMPPNFELGGPNYRERFAEAMGGGHGVPPEKMDNYFAAQCLTDDAMAYHLLEDTSVPLKFLVTGSFHADYGDGAVHRIQVRAPHLHTVVVRLIDASDFKESELIPFLHDPKYGDIADFAFFVNEPN